MATVEVCPVCEAPVAAAQEPASAPPAAMAPTVAPKPKAAPTDILGAARARLEQLELELADMRGKQQEAAMLRRMIAAANGGDTDLTSARLEPIPYALTS